MSDIPETPGTVRAEKIKDYLEHKGNRSSEFWSKREKTVLELLHYRDGVGLIRIVEDASRDNIDLRGGEEIGLQ